MKPITATLMQMIGGRYHQICLRRMLLRKKAKCRMLPQLFFDRMFPDRESSIGFRRHRAGDGKRHAREQDIL